MKTIDRLFDVFNHIFFGIFALICGYPFYYMIIYSISDPVRVAQKGAYLLPRGLDFEAYTAVFKLDGLFTAFLISASRAVIVTMLVIFLTAMHAFVLTKTEFKLRKFLYRVAIVSMYLSAGLIPWYITMKSYGLKDNYLLYILPGLSSPFLLILVKTYIESISPALQESAIIDGANYFTVFWKIIFPLCKPVLAAIAVFCAVGQWNSWQDNLYLVNDPKLQTLQLVMLKYLQQAQNISMSASVDLNQIKKKTLSPMTIRMAITIIGTLPVLFVYPVLQRHFIKGMMIGSVKG